MGRSSSSQAQLQSSFALLRHLGSAKDCTVEVDLNADTDYIPSSKLVQDPETQFDHMVMTKDAPLSTLKPAKIR